MTLDLGQAVAAADVGLVLPQGERRAEVSVQGPLELERALDLGEGRAVAVIRSADGGRWTVPLVAEGTSVRRGCPGDGVAERLLERLSSSDPAAGFSLTRFAVEPAKGERSIQEDQTNESIVVGERAVVKWSVRLPAPGEPGSPAAHKISLLRAAGFTDMPEPWGLVELDGVLLASAVAFIPDAKDGWDWAVRDVTRLGLSAGDLEPLLDSARHLGDMTARMHIALASAGVEHADVDYLWAWAQRAKDELDEALALVLGDPRRRLRLMASRLIALYDGIEDIPRTAIIDVHGDLHVGQILRRDDEYAVTDFDGNPVATAAERAARQPAAVDVVGMMSSLDHVGRVVLRRTPDADQGLVRTWIARSQSEFLEHYRATLRASGLPELLDERLMLPFRAAQEVREHLYAVRYLPDWAQVPDMALAALEL